VVAAVGEQAMTESCHAVVALTRMILIDVCLVLVISDLVIRWTCKTLVDVFCCDSFGWMVNGQNHCMDV
jgi:hypothetical protein